jgi:cytochrome b
LSVTSAVVTAAAVIGLVALRLMWGIPGFAVLMRHFPESWQRWLLGNVNLKVNSQI